MPPVYPLSLVPVSFTGNYPHMAKLDRAVWERYRAAHAADFLGFYYDVALGGYQLTGLGLDEPTLLGWQYNTALKIDVAARTADQIWVIEVRPAATVSALGAAVTYTLVADRDNVFDLPLVPCILCESIQPDVEWACSRLGVTVLRA